MAYSALFIIVQLCHITQLLHFHIKPLLLYRRKTKFNHKNQSYYPAHPPKWHLKQMKSSRNKRQNKTDFIRSSLVSLYSIVRSLSRACGLYVSGDLVYNRGVYQVSIYDDPRVERISERLVESTQAITDWRREGEKPAPRAFNTANLTRWFDGWCLKRILVLLSSTCVKMLTLSLTC